MWLKCLSVGKNAWQVVGLNAAEAGLATIIQKEGEVLSYQITDPGKLDAKYWKNAATELTVASALGAGLPFIGTLMSSQGRSNFKALFNSPNTLNPTQVKIVQATPSARGKELYGSLADTTGGPTPRLLEFPFELPKPQKQPKPGGRLAPCATVILQFAQRNSCTLRNRSRSTGITGHDRRNTH